VQAINYFVAQKYVDALQTIGSAKNSKLILMPLEASSVIGSVAGLAEIAREALSENNNGAGGRDSTGGRARSGSVPSSGND
jgi:regulator of protease activity HflC (stomatin/prohibitin superfamily)